MDEYPFWGSLSFHDPISYGSQSRRLGRVDPDPFPFAKQGTDRAPFLRRKDIYFRKHFFFGRKKLLTHRGCADMREKLFKCTVCIFSWRRIFLAGML